MEAKEVILKGAAELYKRYGIKSITMDEVARHLSVSKKTIYQYFTDKDELVYEIVKSETDTQQCVMNEIADNSSDVIDELMKSSEAMRVKLGQMNPSMLFDLKKYHPKAWHVFHQFKREYMVTFIRKSIERGVKEGYFRKGLNIDVLALLRVEQIDISFDPTIFPPDKFNLVDVNLAFYEHFIFGISTLKGHERLNQLKQLSE